MNKALKPLIMTLNCSGGCGRIRVVLELSPSNT